MVSTVLVYLPKCLACIYWIKWFWCCVFCTHWRISNWIACWICLQKDPQLRVYLWYKVWMERWRYQVGNLNLQNNSLMYNCNKELKFDDCQRINLVCSFVIHASHNNLNVSGQN